VAAEYFFWKPEVLGVKHFSGTRVGKLYEARKEVAITELELVPRSFIEYLIVSGSSLSLTMLEVGVSALTLLLL